MAILIKLLYIGLYAVLVVLFLQKSKLKLKIKYFGIILEFNSHFSNVN